MSFTNPSALLWAAMAVPIVIFYLLKVRLRRVPVATTIFWEQVFEEKPPRAIWRQLRHLLSLFLQLLILGLLVFSLTDPLFTESARQPRRTIVVVDNSASMQAVDKDGRVRLDLAKERVDAIIASLRNEDEMALIAGGNQATVACGLTSHQRTLQTSLESIAVTDGPTRVSEAIELAARLLADHADGRIMVVTDGCFDRHKVSRRPEDPQAVAWTLVGEPVGNVAITQFQVRRSLIDPVGYQVLLEVANLNDQTVDISVDLTLSDVLLDVRPLSLPPRAVKREIYDNTSAVGGLLSATITLDQSEADSLTIDALSVDNQADAILPPRNRIPVTLVTNGNWFLRRVLEASPLVDLTVTDQRPPQSADDAVLVLHQQVPEQVPAGRIFVVQPLSGTELWEVSGDIEQPLVGKQDDVSNLLRFVRLDNVLMPEAKQLIPRAPHEILVEAVSGAPLYIRFPRPQGDVLVLTVNPDLGDLPLRTAFPILFTNALTWFSGHTDAFSEALATGQSATLPLPMELLAASEQNAARLQLVSPAGHVRTISVSAGSTLLPPLDRTGVWTLRGSQTAKSPPEDDTGGTGVRQGSELRIACNLSNPLESDLRPSLDVSSADMAAAGYVGWPVWFYAVIAAFGLLMLEWLFFQRRWIS